MKLLNSLLDEESYSIELNSSAETLILIFLHNSDLFDINYLDFENWDEINCNINFLSELNEIILLLYDDKYDYDIITFIAGPKNNAYLSWFNICQELKVIYDKIESIKAQVSFKKDNYEED
jgi:hypothetical protein